MPSKAQTNLKPNHGPQAVVRFWPFWQNLARPNQLPLTVTQAEINGSPDRLFWLEGSLGIVISLTLNAVGFLEIYALLNPEKLAYLRQQISSSSRQSPDSHQAR